MKASKFILLILVSLLGASDVEAKQPNELAYRLHGSVSKSELADALAKVGIECAVEAETGRVRVRNVKIGTAAYYKGMQADDVLMGVGVHDNEYVVAFRRLNRTYQISTTFRALQDKNSTLKILYGTLARDSTDRGDGAARTLRSTVKDSDLGDSETERKKEPKKLLFPRTLADYDVELLLDKSLSMATAIGIQDLTRFQWCQIQSSELAKVLGRSGRTVTVTLFDTGYEVFPECGPTKIQSIFQDSIPSGDTFLANPLTARLNKHLALREFRPLLLCVITDGGVLDEKDVESSLDAAGRRSENAGPMFLVFLQIGNSGSSLFNELSSRDLGEKLIVRSIGFFELSSRGLPVTLSELLRNLEFGQQSVESIIERNAPNAQLTKTTAKEAEQIKRQRLRVEREFSKRQ